MKITKKKITIAIANFIATVFMFLSAASLITCMGSLFMGLYTSAGLFLFAALVFGLVGWKLLIEIDKYEFKIYVGVKK